MIETLHIKNFKSIKDLKFNCKKLNIFLGDPNTGKSNLLEAIGFVGIEPLEFKQAIRFQGVSNLFFDNDISNKIEIDIFRDKGVQNIKFYYSENKFSLQSTDQSGKNFFSKKFEPDGSPSAWGTFIDSNIRLYKYKEEVLFDDVRPGYLSLPSGKNLITIIKSNKEIREEISTLFTKFGYRLILRERDDRNGDILEIGKSFDEILRLFPFSNVSDTLKRLCFYLVAIESNKHSTILFEEPEAHTFPLYTKALGERIADDESNQYFIITHNPFLLHSLMSKSKKEDLLINIVYTQDFQTKIRQIKEDELQEIISMDYDIFYNLNKFLPYDINRMQP